MNDLESCLARARNRHGPLDDNAKRRIRACVRRRSRKAWDAAANLIVGRDRWMTLWQAVCKVDRSYTFIGPVTTTDGEMLRDWVKVPPGELILDALRLATRAK